MNEIDTKTWKQRPKPAPEPLPHGSPGDVVNLFEGSGHQPNDEAMLSAPGSAGIIQSSSRPTGIFSTPQRRSGAGDELNRQTPGSGTSLFGRADGRMELLQLSTPVRSPAQENGNAPGNRAAEGKRGKRKK